MRHYFSRRLSRKFALSIVGVAVLTIVALGGFSYFTARNALRAEIFAKLQGVRLNKAHQVLDFMAIGLSRTMMLAKEPEVTDALKMLFAYHQATQGITAGTFDVTSEAYQKIHRELEPPFKNRMATNGFEDIDLLCAEHGHVMFSMDQESPLGTSLRDGPFKDTALARIWDRVVRTGKPVIEDFTFYRPSTRPQTFIGAPVFDDQRRVTAVVVEQFSSAPLDEMLAQEEGFGATGEMLLVGEDRLMRSDARLAGGNSVLRRRADTEGVRAALDGRAGTGIFVDYRGVTVLGSYTLLGLKKELGTDFDWVLVAKQDVSEALAPLTTIATQFSAIALGATGFALVVGFVLARSTTRNVVKMAAVADSIAGGNLETPIDVTAADEMGQLADSVLRMQTSLRETQSEIKRAEAEQRKASAYVRSLIEANLDPLVTIGPGGKITDVNDATEEATGLPREKLVGTDFADYFTEPDQARAGYQRVFRDGVVRDYPLELRHRSGRVMAVLYNASVYKDESGAVVGVFAAARDVSEIKAADWLKTGIARLNDVMRGEQNIESLAMKVIAELATYLDAKVGALYVADEDGEVPGALSLLGRYAYTPRKDLPNRFTIGEGLVGQAALERHQILLKNVPEDYIRVVSGLGEAVPRFICVTPFLFEDRVKGVIEIGTLAALSELQLRFLAQAAQAIGVSAEGAQMNTRLAGALERSQRLAEELQTQQEELRVSNEELETQSEALKRASEKLQAQQEELRVSNEELQEKNDVLQRQKGELEQARADIAATAEEVALTSRYKSEFLANMSHELRTPLNSLLLLARGLADNKSGNLTGDQVESARVIHSSGCDLLSLINEILDLSKIEAGRMDLNRADVALQDLADAIRDGFSHMATAQGLGLRVEVEDGLPATIETDAKRLQQVLKNLLSNALKFTKEGSVSVRFHRPTAGTALARSGLDPREAVAISVTDTGIGIAPEHQKIIFEAFQQVDSGTARQYGGTGLGLSISRELIRILGGEIQLQSTAEKGSTFTAYLPVKAHAASGMETEKPSASNRRLPESPSPQQERQPAQRAAKVPDDRAAIAPGDRAILIIEDDVPFATILVGHCHERGFKCLAATTGEEGLDLARRHLPHAVILDLKLPGIDGWQVLDALKDDTRIRHIPVHIISADEPTTKAFRKGAVGHLQKPITPESLSAAFETIEATAIRKVKRLLVVEDDEEMRHRIVELVKDTDVQVDEARGAQEATQALLMGNCDCMILDLGLSDMRGDDLLRVLAKDPAVRIPPVIIYTARDLTREEEARLREHADSIILKDVRSEERLLDEVSLFLHRVVRDMPQRQRQIITGLHSGDTMFSGKSVLIVDDDMRSAFALAKVLAERGLRVVKAENGEKALKMLEEHPDINMVLMDVMMPVMDGYEAIRRIRAQDRFAKLPIITLTAKAMMEDRDKSLAAGANDYLTKPIDQDRLLSLMRVWLYG